MSLKKVKRLAKKLSRNGSLYGFDFDDLKFTKRSIKATGYFSGVGETDLIINFNKKTKVRFIRQSFDFEDYDARMIQSLKFSNYKKYSKATTASRYEKVYGQALNDIGSGISYRIQDGIDALERMPGLSDMQVHLTYFDGNGSYFWT